MTTGHRNEMQEYQNAKNQPVYVFYGLRFLVVTIPIVAFFLCTTACNRENPVIMYKSTPAPSGVLSMLEDAGVKYSSPPMLLYIYHGKERSTGSDEWGLYSAKKFELQPQDGIGRITTITDSDSIAVFAKPFEQRAKSKIPNVECVFLGTWTKNGYEFQITVMQTQKGDYLNLHRFTIK